eukprot:gene25014-31419_t
MHYSEHAADKNAIFFDEGLLKVASGTTIHGYLQSFNADYYRKAIRLVQSQHEHTAFVFFTGGSNNKHEAQRDKDWTRTHLAGNMTYSFHEEGNSHLVSMQSLSLCDVIITAHSTFSWWAAYLSATAVDIVAPRQLFPKSPPRFEPDDFYPASWQLVDSGTPAGKKNYNNFDDSLTPTTTNNADYLSNFVNTSGDLEDSILGELLGGVKRTIKPPSGSHASASTKSTRAQAKLEPLGDDSPDKKAMFAAKSSPETKSKGRSSSPVASLLFTSRGGRASAANSGGRQQSTSNFDAEMSGDFSPMASPEHPSGPNTSSGRPLSGHHRIDSSSGIGGVLHTSNFPDPFAKKTNQKPAHMHHNSFDFNDFPPVADLESPKTANTPLNAPHGSSSRFTFNSTSSVNLGVAGAGSLDGDAPAVGIAGSLPVNKSTKGVTYAEGTNKGSDGGNGNGNAGEGNADGEGAVDMGGFVPSFLEPGRQGRRRRQLGTSPTDKTSSSLNFSDSNNNNNTSNTLNTLNRPSTAPANSNNHNSNNHNSNNHNSNSSNPSGGLDELDLALGLTKVTANPVTKKPVDPFASATSKTATPTATTSKYALGSDSDDSDRESGGYRSAKSRYGSNSFGSFLNKGGAVNKSQSNNNAANITAAATDLTASNATANVTLSSGGVGTGGGINVSPVITTLKGVQSSGGAVNQDAHVPVTTSRTSSNSLNANNNSNNNIVDTLSEDELDVSGIVRSLPDDVLTMGPHTMSGTPLSKQGGVGGGFKHSPHNVSPKNSKAHSSSSFGSALHTASASSNNNTTTNSAVTPRRNSSERIHSLSNAASDRDSGGPGYNNINTSNNNSKVTSVHSYDEANTSPPQNTSSTSNLRGGMKRSPNALKTSASFHQGSASDRDASNINFSAPQRSNSLSSTTSQQFSLHRTHNSNESMTDNTSAYSGNSYNSHTNAITDITPNASNYSVPLTAQTIHQNNNNPSTTNPSDAASDREATDRLRRMQSALDISQSEKEAGERHMRAEIEQLKSRLQSSAVSAVSQQFAQSQYHSGHEDSASNYNNLKVLLDSQSDLKRVISTLELEICRLKDEITIRGGRHLEDMRVIKERHENELGEMALKADIERETIERRHSEAIAALRNLHAEEVSMLKDKTKSSDLFAQMAGTMRSTTGSIKLIEEQLAVKYHQVELQREGQIAARERLLQDMEDKARERVEAAEAEGFKLKGILSHMDSVVQSLRSQGGEEKERLRQEHVRLKDLQSSVENEKALLHTRNAEELAYVKQRSKEVEIELTKLSVEKGAYLEYVSSMQRKIDLERTEFTQSVNATKRSLDEKVAHAKEEEARLARLRDEILSDKAVFEQRRASALREIRDIEGTKARVGEMESNLARESDALRAMARQYQVAAEELSSQQASLDEQSAALEERELALREGFVHMKQAASTLSQRERGVHDSMLLLDGKKHDLERVDREILDRKLAGAASHREWLNTSGAMINFHQNLPNGGGGLRTSQTHSPSSPWHAQQHTPAGGQQQNEDPHSYRHYDRAVPPPPSFHHQDGQQQQRGHGHNNHSNSYQYPQEEVKENVYASQGQGQQQQQMRPHQHQGGGSWMDDFQRKLKHSYAAGVTGGDMTDTVGDHSPLPKELRIAQQAMKANRAALSRIGSNSVNVQMSLTSESEFLNVIRKKQQQQSRA